MPSDFNFILSIQPLTDDDNFAVINNQAAFPPVNADPNDLGGFFDLISGEINNSIINLDIISKFTLTISSRVENIFIQDIQNSATSQSNNDSSILQQLTDFTQSLEGRPVQIQRIDPDQNSDIVYYGFIKRTPDSISVRGGTQFQIQCGTVLSQLSVLASNNSWQDTTLTYGNVFSMLNANTINFNLLLDVLTRGTLAEDSNIIFNDGASTPIPDTVWATILPNKDKLSVLREIMIPYSKVIYQRDNGDICIQPLFVDDTADEIFNVNCFSNTDNAWIGFNSINNAACLPNRIDVIFGPNLPYDPFGGPDSDDIEIFATTPKVNQTTKQIDPLGVDGVLDYSDVYASSVRLYNSGKFIMPEMITLGIDNSLILNSQLLNSMTSMYETKDFRYSNVYVSGSLEYNSVALLYSQIYMAQYNVENYNATIVYDYLQVYDAESPLAKVVTIDNAQKIDYPQMLVAATSLSFSVSAGTLFTVDTVPLLSITGVWSSIDGNN